MQTSAGAWKGSPEPSRRWRWARDRLARGLRPVSALAALLRPLRTLGGGRNGRLLGAIDSLASPFRVLFAPFPPWGRGEISPLREPEFDSCGLDYLACDAREEVVGSVDAAIRVDTAEDRPGRVAGERASGNGGVNCVGGVSRHTAGA
ncbi:MAG: hypothetical protein OXG81_13910 [Acidobacteria bacterium]|nr:hypothetical protein [Acidobacteriota bacterium]